MLIFSFQQEKRQHVKNKNGSKKYCCPEFSFQESFLDHLWCGSRQHMLVFFNILSQHLACCALIQGVLNKRCLCLIFFSSVTQLGSVSCFYLYLLIYGLILAFSYEAQPLYPALILKAGQDKCTKRSHSEGLGQPVMGPLEQLPRLPVQELILCGLLTPSF